MREFLAIPLPEALRRDAASLARTLPLPPRSWRFVREEGLHVTVRFLGEIDRGLHDRMDAASREAVGGVRAMRLRVLTAEAAPSARRPRIVWFPVRDESPDGSLAQLASRIERAARMCGLPPEERPFAGHVTLARARRGSRVPAADLSAGPDLGCFIADRLVLYRSSLGAGGSTYEELASYSLDACGPS